MNIPEFITNRLILKGVTLEDVPSYEKYFVDYKVIRFLSAAVPWPYPNDGITTFLKDLILPHQGKDRWMWGIFMKENKRDLIGCVDLWRDGKPENRGFWLGHKFWGKGIMTEAVQPVTDYAFDSLGFEKLVFTNAVGNIGSHRVKEKTGAKMLGVKTAKFVDPAFTQHEIWELQKQDWMKFRSHNEVVGDSYEYKQ